MPLRPINLDETLIGQTLPWDLYTASGVLVAAAGLAIADPAQLARLSARPLFRRAMAAADDADLVKRLRFVMREYPLALKAAGTVAFEAAIRDLARELMALAALDHDACLGLARLLPMRDPAAHHCLLTALLVNDLGEQVDLSGKAVEAAVAASLTMNIAAMAMHAELAEGRLRFSHEVRDEIHRHPEAGAALLEEGGVTDTVWLAAVRQHHENLDGSGYPLGLRNDEIGTAARLIRVADYYAAKISGRRYRPPKSSKFALKQLFGGERGRVDSHVALLLPRRLGLYPPGTLVRLATREVAVVLRKEGSGESAGHAMAFMEHRERLLKEPVERDTALVNYAVIGIAEPEPHWPEIRWEAYWGY